MRSEEVLRVKNCAAEHNREARPVFVERCAFVAGRRDSLMKEEE
jgi:hypothetical protein